MQNKQGDKLGRKEVIGMENLIFSLNATVPVFVLMLLGMLFRKCGWIDEVFAAKMNRFTFMVPLPTLVFRDLASVHFEEVWDLKYIIFCFAATLLSIIIASVVASFFGERKIRGEFIQASYRSSAAILGIALIQNIYGTSGMAPLMFIGSVPLYNVMAVVVLSIYATEANSFDSNLVKKSLVGIVRNPIIIAIVIGLLWSALEAPMPLILEKTVSNVAGMATPMGLITMGASFHMKDAMKKAKPTVVASFLKLIGFCALFLPLAILLGFRREGLVAILVMLGSATTVSSFVMAENMGHEGVLSASVVMLTTLFSGFTLTFWLWLLRTFQFI